jgi:hypothetical protein
MILYHTVALFIMVCSLALAFCLITLEHTDRAPHGEDAAAAARHDNSWRASTSTGHSKLVLGAAGLW